MVEKLAHLWAVQVTSGQQVLFHISGLLFVCCGVPKKPKQSALQLNVDCGARIHTMSTQRRPSKVLNNWHPGGPEDLKGVLDMSVHAIEDILQYSRLHGHFQLEALLARVVNDGIVVSLCFFRHRVLGGKVPANLQRVEQ